MDIPEKHQQVDVELWFLTGVHASSFFIVKVKPVSWPNAMVPVRTNRMISWKIFFILRIIGL
jgi:hypothetical protein